MLIKDLKKLLGLVVALLVSFLFIWMVAKYKNIILPWFIKNG
ncbi:MULTISPECIES: hypothetical protein [Heyndrickxia]|nr:hypothetical protein [Heyndrickxia shackletonii]